MTSLQGLLRRFGAAGAALTCAALAVAVFGTTAAQASPLRASAIAAQPGQASNGASNYHVTFHTGDRANAGTDGDVYLKLYGNKNGVGTSSPWLYLDDSSNNWERNRYDVFDRYLTDLGTIKQACVYFDDHGGYYSDWYLDWVTVNGKFFQYYRWFTHTEIACRYAS